MHFGLRVKAALKAAGMRQKDLADKIGVTEPRISHLIKREAKPEGVGAIAEIARALGLNVNVLLDEDAPFVFNNAQSEEQPQKTPAEVLGGDFAVRISDDSNIPSLGAGIPAGAMAVIKKTSEPIKALVGRLVCVRSRQSGADILRMLNMDFDDYILEPLNDKYKRREFDPEVMEVVGYCVAFYMKVGD